MKTVVLATHFPFWWRDRGAAHRLYALHRFLVKQGFRVPVFYLNLLSGRDKRRITQILPDLEIHRPALRFLLARKLKRRLRRSLPSLISTPFQGATREDQAAFRRFCRRLQPEVVIIEYLELAGLVQGLQAALDQPPLTIIDTIDVVSLRTARLLAHHAAPHSPAHVEEASSLFVAHSAPHKGLTPEQERQMLDVFDVILAIQPAEAAIFQTMLPGKEVVVAGHPGEVRPFAFREAAPVRLLFVGAGGEHNRLTIADFLEEVWPPLYEAHRGAVELAITGRVCEHLDASRVPSGVLLRGFVEDLDAVYRETDIVINPIHAGSGLKIKNVEALCHGKPLVTTPLGAEGLDEGAGEAFLCCSGAEETRAALADLIGDGALRRRFAEAAHRFATEHLSEERAFGELLRVLERSGVA